MEFTAALEFRISSQRFTGFVTPTARLRFYRPGLGIQEVADGYIVVQGIDEQGDVLAHVTVYIIRAA